MSLIWLVIALITWEMAERSKDKGFLQAACFAGAVGGVVGLALAVQGFVPDLQRDRSFFDFCTAVVNGCFSWILYVFRIQYSDWEGVPFLSIANSKL